MEVGQLGCQHCWHLFLLTEEGGSLLFKLDSSYQLRSHDPCLLSRPMIVTSLNAKNRDNNLVCYAGRYWRYTTVVYFNIFIRTKRWLFVT